MPIHPTAIVSIKAELDATVDVGPFCVLDEHVRIAAGCKLHQGVYVTGWTQIDEECVLHPGAIVGHEPQDVQYGGERSYCRVGRGTVVREYVTVHRGTVPDSETVIGAECFLLAGSHVAHNCVLGNNVTMVNDVLLAGHVEVGDGVTFGGGAAVHQFARIGSLAMVAGHARVSKDVPPFAMVDIDGFVVGLNRVGMKRAGLSADDRRDVRNAYRVLYEQGLTVEQAAERIESDGASAPTAQILAFLQRPTKRGLAQRRREARPDSPEET